MWGTEPDNPASAGASPHQLYRFANALLDESTSQLRVSGLVVQFERLPMQLLIELLRRTDEVITKEQLCELLWAGRPMGDNVLANAVSKLRRALGEQAGSQIVTLSRIGYRLVGPVEIAPAGRAAMQTDVLRPGSAVPGRDGYVLERRLDGQGLRHVWLARHTKTQDAKVFKFADDGLGLAALKREFDGYRLLRRALGEALPLVRLLDANLQSSPFYLECEYLGSDLTRWADDGGRLGTVPWPQRLALFIQVARAVSAAHGIGLLHRDLRPTHVWVRGSPGAWVAALTDFASAPGAETARGDTCGQADVPVLIAQTPVATNDDRMYVAPELLAGQVPTQQGDLYALGVMLYQLWVADLRRPIAVGWQRELADDNCLQDDIAAATAADPVLRLGSVAELLNRLTQLDARREQALRQERETRRLQDATARLHSLRRRRPWELAAFAALLLGLVISLWLGGSADRLGSWKFVSHWVYSGSQT